MKEERTCWKR